MEQATKEKAENPTAFGVPLAMGHCKYKFALLTKDGISTDFHIRFQTRNACGWYPICHGRSNHRICCVISTFFSLSLSFYFYLMCITCIDFEWPYSLHVNHSWLSSNSRRRYSFSTEKKRKKPTSLFNR